MESAEATQSIPKHQVGYGGRRTRHDGFQFHGFTQLPGDVFVRGFVKSYAKALGIESDTLIQRLESDRQQQSQLEVVGMAGEPERARRVGVAVAMIILLFLFTLALSIVLRPRRHDRPAELSQAAPAMLEAVTIG